MAPDRSYLERYEPNVKIVFRRNPDYFRPGQPYVDGVEWLVLDDESTALAMYRTGQLDAGPGLQWDVRQADLDSLKQSHPHLRYQDIQSNTKTTIWMRTDQPPFTDVRVRRAISHAVDRQGLIEAVWMRGQPSPAVAPGLAEWSLPIDQLGEGAKYYRYDPQEARRLLAEAGYAKGLKTTLTTTSGYGRDLIDAAQLVQRYLKDVGIEAELKLQEYGAYQATTGQGKFEGLAMGPYGGGWEPDSALYGPYTPDQLRNRGHVNDPKLAAMLQEQRRLKDPEARKQLIFAMQRLCGGAAVLRVPVLPGRHGLLAAVCEELRPEPECRLRQSRRRPVAGSIGRGGGRGGGQCQWPQRALCLLAAQAMRP